MSIIIAEDGGSPPLIGSATLTIVISDINDTAHSSQTHKSTSPRTGMLLWAHHLQLFRLWTETWNNAQITYSYSQKVPQASKDLFHLNENTGVIKLFSKIGGSVLQTHKLTILANGPGCIPAVITALVTIIRVIFRPPEIVLVI